MASGRPPRRVPFALRARARARSRRWAARTSGPALDGDLDDVPRLMVTFDQAGAPQRQLARFWENRQR
ncbi:MULTISPECIES: hypothetical protein [unclassified Streptomyces]|uniref:hypothetical protein n=1 Tax=unclassified Streptomyces TaxID=2593676 RepID=UPI0003A1559B|nr:MULTISPECIES: hypothetical protein [unclassified Streptomyces]